MDRVAIWRETQRAAARLPPPPRSVKCNYNPHFDLDRPHKTTIKVVDEDTLTAAKALIDDGANPLVLNMANDVYCGGNVDNGAGAQEESLFRRTNLCATLEQGMYPILDHQAIYSPRVTVFRKPELDGYEYYTEPFLPSFVAVAGLKFPQTTGGRLSAQDVDRLSRKFALIIQIAAANGHDSLVLGALGCGAFCCPPQHVAEIFKSVLQDSKGAFKHVVFACMSSSGDFVRNIDVFQRVLASP